MRASEKYEFLILSSRTCAHGRASGGLQNSGELLKVVPVQGSSQKTSENPSPKPQTPSLFIRAQYLAAALALARFDIDLASDSLSSLMLKNEMTHAGFAPHKDQGTGTTICFRVLGF